MPTNEQWGHVRDTLAEAKGIAWDGCHKIYVLMDDEQMALMAEYGYETLLPVPEDTASEALDILCDWYEQSCMLRFISSIRTVKGDPNKGFDDLIPQGADDEEDEPEYADENDDEDEEI